jgi:AcrR family transcriptional regulator
MVKAASATPLREERREAIMTVAREVFFEHGYSGTSMSAIAARLGGSKGTLYNYFKNKEELFEAQVRDLCGAAATFILASTAEGSPIETLTLFGERYLRHLYSEQTINLFRILVAESRRSPELGRLFYEVGPARARKGLETYLQTAKARGLLVEPPDCALAADQFLSLCKGPAHLQFLLNLIPAPTPQEIRLHVERAVGAFMTLYGSKGSDRAR